VSRRQAPYEGSNRQVRGRVLGELRHASRDADALAARLGDVDRSRLDLTVKGLIDDGLVERRSGVLALARA
jgi:DNA-binding HxlR family transcriptional regulator